MNVSTFKGQQIPRSCQLRHSGTRDTALPHSIEGNKNDDSEWAERIPGVMESCHRMRTLRTPARTTQPSWLQLSCSAGAGAVAGVGAAGCCVIIHDCCWLQLPRTAVVVLQPRRRSDPRDGMRKTNSEQFYTYTATVSPRYHRSILLGIANNCRPVDAISKCKFSII